MSIASLSARPSPPYGRVGVHIVSFEACSGFTHVTARWIAQPPKAAFVTRLRPVRLLVPAARQLPDQPTTLWVESPSTGDNAPSGRTIGFDIGRRHHPRVMAELDQLASPMMGRTAGFHTDKTLGQLGEEGQHVLAPEPPGDDHAPRSVNVMLGQIEANRRDRRQIGDRLSHGRCSFRGLLDDNHLGTALNRAEMPVRAPSITLVKLRAMWSNTCREFAS